MSAIDTETIRPYQKGDRNALLHAIEDLQEFERMLHLSRLPGKMIADPYLEWLESHVAEHSGTLLVAEIENQFAGFIAGWIEEENNPAETPDSNRFGYLSDVYVIPNYRGQGIAQQLLAAAEKNLAAKGVSWMRVSSLAANFTALLAYQKAGFKLYETILEKPILS